MNCSKCGTTINQGESFCRMCGTKVVLPQNSSANTNDVPNIFQSNVQQGVNNVQPISEQQGISNVQPINTQQGISNVQPINTQQGISNVQPINTQQGVSSAQPINTQQGVSNVQPINVQQGVSSVQPTNTQQDVSNVQPINVQQGVSSVQPINVQQGVSSVQPINTQQGASSVQPINIQPGISNNETTINQTENKPEYGGIKNDPNRYKGVVNVIEDDLTDVYIGKNANKLKNGFSFCAFFFGNIYAFYRKMWLLGFVWLISGSIIGAIFGKLAFIVNLVINIIISVNFKKLYLKHVNKQIDKIKLENQDKTKEQIMVICGKKGGTSMIPIVIMIVLFVAFILSAYFFVHNIIATLF